MKLRPQLNPLTQRQLARFRSLKRGYWSAVILLITIVLSIGAELLVNSRALIVSYEGNWFFPTYSKYLPGSTFDLGYEYETNFRELKAVFERQPSNSNWVIMPLVPYNAFEVDLPAGRYPPNAP